MTPSVLTTSATTRGMPSAYTWSMTRWSSREVGSVHTSEAGLPTTSIPVSRQSSGSATSTTWDGPRKSARTAIIGVPQSGARSVPDDSPMMTAVNVKLSVAVPAGNGKWGDQ